MMRECFLGTYSVDPPTINGDKRPQHRNESTIQRAVSLKSEATFVKEIVYAFKGKGDLLYSTL